MCFVCVFKSSVGLVKGKAPDSQSLLNTLNMTSPHHIMVIGTPAEDLIRLDQKFNPSHAVDVDVQVLESSLGSARHQPSTFCAVLWMRIFFVCLPLFWGAFVFLNMLAELFTFQLHVNTD
jgi:hypothetical protein